jgi:hypothetical protein
MAQSRTPDKFGADGADDAESGSQSVRFINPHRLFHGVWLPQWLEERPEVSERAKKLYAYLTYFAGGKGYAWPSFNHLAEKLHISATFSSSSPSKANSATAPPPTVLSDTIAAASPCRARFLDGCKPAQISRPAWLRPPIRSVLAPPRHPAPGGTNRRSYFAPRRGTTSFISPRPLRPASTIRRT